MASDHLDMHIVLNEDLIDLRQESFDLSTPDPNPGIQKLSIKNRSPHRTSSQQVISPSQPPGELRDRKPLRVNGLRRLANNLYFGDQPSPLQRNKTPLRSKQRNRATSADPRFRRERSPAFSKEATQTQSDSQVMDAPMQFKKKKNKTHSDSKFILDNSSNSKKSIPKPSGPYPCDQSEPVNCKGSFDLKRSPSYEQSVRNSIHDKITTISHLYSCGTLSRTNAEQSTMTEDCKSSPTPADCKSLYQSAVTDTHIAKGNANMELYNAAKIHLDSKEHLKPYWDDPRLIEKYSKLLKPVHIHKSKSSLTLPLEKPPKNAVACTKPRPMCSKCVCTTLHNDLEKVYETYGEICETTFSYNMLKAKVLNTVESNYYLAAFFMIGSICGLLLVALVIWVLTNDMIWAYLNREEPPKVTGLKWLTAYIGGAILHSINVLVNKIYYMIIMPRNELFDLLRAEEAT